MSMPTQKVSSQAVAGERSYRLPRNVLPSNYRLVFEPDFESKTFAGDVTIDIEVLSPTNKIIVNAKELEMLEIVVKDSKEKWFNGSVVCDSETELATITFPETLAPGHWQLSANFKGVHNDKLKGFYRSTWTDDSGNKHMMVSTQFESTDARRAFPCFDEPDMKATFEVSLVVPKNLVAVSNGRLVEELDLPSSNKKTVRFRKTMKMSTYLLAMVVGDLKPSKTVRTNGVDLCVWTVPGKTHLSEFALKVAAFTVNFFEEYFRVKYPDADKCDLVAIPDFASGAMENKDCITFRETALLVDEATATHAELERVAEVVMHELAHMWFGDLVTMRWWNGLWLNEAFATFMEVKCLDAFRKDWRVWDGFGISRAAAARVDALKSTHPIECPVNRPEEAQELFDVISYRKGCSVLYQIEQFIGEEIFRNGITHYLKTHAFANTETHDLWDSLELACKEAGSGTPVRKIMDAWVFTAGHPFVSVSKGEKAGSVSLEQSQFKFLPGSEDKGQLYPVPISLRAKIASGKTVNQKFLLEAKQHSLTIGEAIDWVVINAGGSGFYRARYEPSLALSLTERVKDNLSVIERFNLVNDTWSSLRGGLTSAPDYLEMLKGFVEENDVNVWSIISGSLQTLHLLTAGESRLAFQKLARSICGPQAKNLGWVPKKDESVQTKQMRALLLELLGTIGADEAVIKSAVEYFSKWKKDKASVDANLVPALVNILAYHGDDKRYQEFRTAYKEGKTPQEVIRFLYSLAAFRDPSLLEITMASCLSDEVKTQDAPYLFAAVAQNEVGTEAAWEFMKRNWNQMVKAYPENGVVRMCAAVIQTLDRNGLEKDAFDFFTKHKVESGEMAVAQGLELLHVNVLLRERESKRLAKYLETGTATKAPATSTKGGNGEGDRPAPKRGKSGGYTKNS
jgi:puromycin-sensitive aminopeptidase